MNGIHSANRPHRSPRPRRFGWPFYILLAVLLAAGCLGDVPHENPLDPSSPFFRNAGQVRVRVTTFYPPFQPLDSARVEVEPGPWSAMTDQDGEFVFAELPAGVYTLTAYRDGHASDSAAVAVAAGRTVDVTLRLDALPVFRSALLRSAHISRWWPLEDLYMVLFEAELLDPDGIADVQTVVALSPTLSLLDTLAPGPRAGVFSRTRRAGELTTGSVHRLLGHAFEFVATDAPGNSSRSAPVFLARVIEQVPDGLSSPDTLTAGTVISLSWNPMALPFPVTYRVEVIRNETGIPPTLVWTATNLFEPQTAISDSLPAGTYFWTVAAIDEFGNWSRSREAVFVITP